MISPQESLCTSACWAAWLGGSAAMPTLPSLSSLGRICGSSHADDTLVLDRVKRKNSVRRMSIIEDGEIAEVLYLIPKQSMMEQLPFLNPNDYILCEKMAGMPLEMPQGMQHACQAPCGALGLIQVRCRVRDGYVEVHCIQVEISAYQSPGLAPPPLAPERRRVQCFRCGGACKGEVLRVQARHFHLNCFTCKVCGCDLAHGGFFLRSGDYLCTLDYQRLHGTRCQGCGEYVEGEVVTALGKAYHPACFVCTSCRRPFPTGDRVTFNRKECLCQHCSIKPHPSSPNHNSFSNNCVGCGRDIKNGQALLALQGQWHLGCFKCNTCHRLLTGEYISRDGLPYCERDYQVQFGVQCDACYQFITGKVLEAGDRHFHPSCARCCRCDLVFREGEEMFLQGSAMWHLDCRSDSRGDSRYRASRSSTESISSRPGSTRPISPGHSIYAKVDDQVVDYRDLAALPRVKAILDIERPDLLSYSSFSHTQDNQSSTQDRPLPAQCQPAGIPSPILNEVSPEGRRRSRAPGSIHRHSYTPTVSPQHFHRPRVTSCLSASLFSSSFSDHFLPLTADTPAAGFQTSSLPGYGRHSGVFCQVYPYEVLAVTGGRANLPKNVDRTRLERYLSPDSFYKVFEMDFQDFNQLPLWKRNDLKKIVNLF
ncbi:Actin-binding LIM protein 1 [Merluccius polli]|uniref:Actin-binding LIM protein 1 n=1 Tax=Merluccius polli TaxID=89951 RepID=A0AA47N765_MERPO|nr:Actin-binding LIM protein 1 [Merluccius polli]